MGGKAEGALARVPALGLLVDNMNPFSFGFSGAWFFHFSLVGVDHLLNLTSHKQVVKVKGDLVGVL